VTEEPARGRLADLPLEERRRLEVEKQRELSDGLMRRHVANATFERLSLADQVARVPALAAKLRGE
jgi:hypothetical protein